MGLSRGLLDSIRREAERQGATVTWCKKGLRVKGPNGKVEIVHTSPRQPDTYRKNLVRDLRQVGVEAPGGKW